MEDANQAREKQKTELAIYLYELISVIHCNCYYFKLSLYTLINANNDMNFMLNAISDA